MPFYFYIHESSIEVYNRYFNGNRIPKIKNSLYSLLPIKPSTFRTSPIVIAYFIFISCGQKIYRDTMLLSISLYSCNNQEKKTIKRKENPLSQPTLEIIFSIFYQLITSTAEFISNDCIVYTPVFLSSFPGE